MIPILPGQHDGSQQGFLDLGLGVGALLLEDILHLKEKSEMKENFRENDATTYQLISRLHPENLVRDVQVEHDAPFVLLDSGDVAGPDLQLVLRHHVTVGWLVEVLVHLNHLQGPHDPPEERNKGVCI